MYECAWNISHYGHLKFIKLTPFELNEVQNERELIIIMMDVY